MVGRRLRITLLAAVLLTLLAVTTIAAAGLADVRLVWWFLGSGGGRVTSPSYTLRSAAGQPVVGSASTAALSLCAGVWCGAEAQSADGWSVYLPLVERCCSNPSY